MSEFPENIVYVDAPTFDALQVLVRRFADKLIGPDEYARSALALCPDLELFKNNVVRVKP